MAPMAPSLHSVGRVVYVCSAANYPHSTVVGYFKGRTVLISDRRSDQISMKNC